MRKIFVFLSLCAISFMLWGCGGNKVVATEPQSITETEYIEEIVPSLIDEVVRVEPESIFVEVATEPVVTEPLYQKYEYFSEDVYYEWEYIENGEVIPHIFFEPSTSEDYEKLPLIVWLHGSGEKARPAIELQWSGLPKAMSAWDFMHLEGLNAYIVAPHLVQGEFWSPYWCTEGAANNIQALIDYYVHFYNIDPNQIVIAGHSLGGQGVAYLTQVLPDTFCAAAPLSVYHPCVKLTNSKIPVWCFQGNPSNGEDKVSHEYAYGDWAYFYGYDTITMLNVGHGDLPMAVFSMDKDGNNRTDLFEWFAEQMQHSAAQSLKEKLKAGLAAEDLTM